MATLPKGMIKRLPKAIRREIWVAGFGAAQATTLEFDSGLVEITIRVDFNSAENAVAHLKGQGFRFITGSTVKEVKP